MKARNTLWMLILASSLLSCGSPTPDPKPKPIAPMGRARAAFAKNDLNGTFAALSEARARGLSPVIYNPLANELVEQMQDRLTLMGVLHAIPYTLDPENPQIRRDTANMSNIADYLCHAHFLAGRFDKKNNILMRIEAPSAAVFEPLDPIGDFAGTVAAADIDGDGKAEILVDGRRLYSVNGDGQLQPFKVSLPRTSGNNKKIKARAGLITDINNDGRPDILRLMGRRVFLLLQDKNGSFSNRTKGSGLEKPLEADIHSAAFGDVNGDGLPDLYLGAYQMSGKDKMKGAADKFFINLGNGTFRDETDKRNLKLERNNPSRAITFGDIDNDGDLDLFVGNYRLHPNRLWINSEGEFIEEARERNVMGVEANPPTDINPENETPNYCGHTIGGCFGDIDNDGDLDLLVGNLAHPRYISFSNPSSLLINPGIDDAWKDVFKSSGLRFSETHSDVSMADVDNDGDLDIFITAIYPSRPSRLFLNQTKGPGKPLLFRESTWHSGILAFDSWGHCWVDLENDGDLDLIIASRKDGLLTFRNKGVPHHNWLRIAPNPATPGTRVTVSDGTRVLIRDIYVGRSFAIQDEPVAHFGLGQSAKKLNVTVTWPNGKLARRTVSPGQRIEIKASE